MHSPGRVALAIVLLGASACTTRQAGEASGSSDYAASPTQYSVEQAGRAGAVKDQDRRFVYEAATGGMAEIAYGQMAEQKARSLSVKNFARQMVNDHSQADTQLRQLAVQMAGIQPPTGLDPTHIAKRDQLAALTGQAFDRAYMQNQVEEHRNAVLLYQQELSYGGQPNLQRFAGDTLPILQQHLQSAQTIEAQLRAQPPQSSDLSGASSLPRQ